MGVAVYEARHDHASTGANFHSIARQRKVFYAAGRTDLLQDPITHQERPVMDNGQFL